MIDRDYQPRVDTVDNTAVDVTLWCDLAHDFMQAALYGRYGWGAAMWGIAREYCPERWAEMNAIEEELRRFLKPGVEVPAREVLSCLRLWREAALRVEFAMMGI